MPISENDWRTLLYKIRMGRCTPFVGAGASYPTLPLAAQLATTLVDEYERESSRSCPLPDRGDLAKVTEFLAITYKDAILPKLRIADHIRRLGGSDLGNENDIHRILADFDLPIYLTTNYDDFMLSAIRRTRPAVKREYSRWTKTLLENKASEFDRGYEPTRDQPVVFHLHGHTEVPDAMVVSEDDYLDFLVNTSKDLGVSPLDTRMKTMLPLPIRTAIMTTTLLFVGYGLSDINFRVVLRGLLGSLEPSGQQINIAVQFAGNSTKELQEYLEQYFERTLKLNIFWGSASDFAVKLRELWKAP